MIRWLLLLAFGLVLAACASQTDTRPLAEQQAERLLERGVAAYQQGDALTASHHFKRALAKYQGFDQRSGQLQAHLNLAASLLQLGRLEAAREQALIAIQLARVLDEPEYYQQALWLQARWAWLAGEVDLSRDYLDGLLNAEQSLAPAVELSALALRAHLALHLADDSSWLERFEERLAGQQAAAHQLQLRRLQAWQQGLEGDFTAAVQELEAVLAVYREQAQRPSLAATLTELGHLHQRQGELEAAEDLFKRALRVRLHMQDRHHSRQLLLDLAAVYRTQGQEQLALAAEQQAENL